MDFHITNSSFKTWGLNFWNVGYEFTQGSNVDDVDYITQLASFLQTLEP